MAHPADDRALAVRRGRLGLDTAVSPSSKSLSRRPQPIRGCSGPKLDGSRRDFQPRVPARRMDRRGQVYQRARTRADPPPLRGRGLDFVRASRRLRHRALGRAAGRLVLVRDRVGVQAPVLYRPAAAHLRLKIKAILDHPLGTPMPTMGISTIPDLPDDARAAQRSSRIRKLPAGHCRLRPRRRPGKSRRYGTRCRPKASRLTGDRAETQQAKSAAAARSSER